MSPNVTVVGSVNLDLVARLPRLPRPGETLTASGFDRMPGGKGANQALAARRLGAEVRLVAAVGSDPLAAEALAQLTEDGVQLDPVRTVAGPTGLAMIGVDDAGDTTIVVVPGANHELVVHPAELEGAEAVLTVLEVPDAAVATAAKAPGFVALNAAPARPVAADVLRRTDLVVVNRAEYTAIDGIDAARTVAVTAGEAGAVLLRGGREVARAQPPQVVPVDGTGAGDAFAAALAIGLVEGRDDVDALRRACAAGALAASRPGAQPSLPWAADLEELG